MMESLKSLFLAFIVHMINIIHILDYNVVHTITST